MGSGILLKSKKESSLLSWTIRRPLPPKKVRIPYGGFSGPAAAPCVELGARVKVGEKIALPSREESLAIHASVSGEVTGIGFFPHPLNGAAPAIEITSDQRDARLPEIGMERKGWEIFPGEDYLNFFREAGLTDLNRQGVPLHTKVLKYRGIHTLILNACESDPYVTADHALMMAHSLEILKGAEILRRALGAQRVMIATEANKLEAAEILKSKIYFLKWKNFEVQILPAVFPQDEPALLIEKFRSKAAASQDPMAVFELATAFAVYEAVVLQKPFYERVVTVSGECIVEPQNIWARAGADLESLIKSARGFLRQPGKIIMGGAMRGIAQEHLAVPVIASTTAVLGLPQEIVKPERVEPCIRCGECVAHCPVEISPVMITLAAERDLFEAARDYGAQHCIECGNCSYVCPSKRPMLELLRYASSRLQGQARREETGFEMEYPQRNVEVAVTSAYGEK